MKIPGYIRPFLALLLIVCGDLAWGDNPTNLPYKSFPIDRYKILWTKSPFEVVSVAAPPKSDAPAAYKLVGVFQLAGNFYASVVDNQSGEGIFLEQNKPCKGLTLVSVQQGKTGSISHATVLARGQSLVLATDNKQQTSLPEPTNPGNVGGIQSGVFPRLPPRFPARRELVHVPTSQITPASGGSPH